jgi:hypothetical protein
MRRPHRVGLIGLAVELLRDPLLPVTDRRCLPAWPHGSQAFWSWLRVFSVSCGFHQRLLRSNPVTVAHGRAFLI